MNIDKLKNLFIIFFLLLNIGLLVLNYMDSRHYVMTSGQESTIKNLLSNNGITVQNTIPRDFSPKRNLSVSPIFFGFDDLKSIFFDDDENVSKIDEMNRVTYITESKSLIIQDESVYFEDMSYPPYNDLPEDEIDAVCEGYIAEISKLNKSIELFMSKKYEDGNELIIDFCGRYDKTVIYSNFMRFRFSTAGAIELEFAFAEVNGYIGEKKDIYSSNEILLSLMYEIKNIYEDGQVVIEDIDIVYRISGSSGGSGGQAATPFYRVYVKSQPRPFLVDAYFNKVIL